MARCRAIEARQAAAGTGRNLGVSGLQAYNCARFEICTSCLNPDRGRLPRGDDAMRTCLLAFAILGKTAEAGIYPSAMQSWLGPPSNDAITDVRADERVRSSGSFFL